MVGSLWFSHTRRFWLHLVQLGVEVGSHRLGVVELLRVVAVASEGGEPAQDALHNDVLDLENRINFEYERVPLERTTREAQLNPCCSSGGNSKMLNG